MKILSLFLFLLLILPFLNLIFITSSQVSISYPMGISFYSLFNTYYTNYVLGVINISSMYIGSSYLPNGEYLTTGNASLQLNAMINGIYWAQNVILFHQISNKSFLVTLVLNLWNLTGSFSIPLKGQVSNYQGFGVTCYQGPTFNITLPTSISLFMIINSSLYFGYVINGKKGIYYVAPISGEFEVGGLSEAGVPNDLEFVFGGPGGGSYVSMDIDATMNLYFLNDGKFSIVPYAYSTGFDTAESVLGVSSVANLNNLWNPFVNLLSGSDDPTVLWPVKPQISLNQNGSKVIVNLSYNGKPISNQEIEIETVSLTGLTPIAINYTNTMGFTTFENISSSLYVVYYPGNFTLSSSYILSSPFLNSIISHLKTIYDKMISFIKSYNYKKALVSFFNSASKISYNAKTSINYTLLIYILGFVIGIVISAILIRFKL